MWRCCRTFCRISGCAAVPAAPPVSAPFMISGGTAEPAAGFLGVLQNLLHPQFQRLAGYWRYCRTCCRISGGAAEPAGRAVSAPGRLLGVLRKLRQDCWRFCRPCCTPGCGPLTVLGGCQKPHSVYMKDSKKLVQACLQSFDNVCGRVIQV